LVNQHETLSAEKQQEILEKYDPESATRKLKGSMKVVVFIGLLAFSIFQLYASISQTVPRQILLSIHLGFALSLIFILFPANRKTRKKRFSGLV